MHKLEQPHQFVQIFCIFYKKNLLFLFYTSTFTKYSYQFIYFTHLFNKIFILLHFLLFSHSWPLSLSLSLSLSQRPSHHHHHSVTIKPKPGSLRPKICDFFCFLFSWLIGAETQMKPKPKSSRNPDLFKQKPKVDRSEG